MTVRQGGAADACLVLRLFDEAVAWLVARGQTGQWGIEPFSSRPATVRRIEAWAAGGGLRVAEGRDGSALGALVLGAAPPYVAPVDADERYVEALVTARRHAGRDVGGALLRAAAAEARAAGATLLRVDCWAGSDALVGWYERQGFRREGRFEVDGWRGQVLAMPLAAP
ncbi:MAG TPA: GNAT family N-acetyltransferase [Solirubrobacteraceae bacterium]|nr:GNAT family N-acetyltransferase [Solirubrobacteraceae bacterium]